MGHPGLQLPPFKDVSAEMFHTAKFSLLQNASEFIAILVLAWEIWLYTIQSVHTSLMHVQCAEKLTVEYLLQTTGRGWTGTTNTSWG